MTSSLTPGASYYPYIALMHGIAKANFGEDGFQYDIPDGYEPYNANLAAVSSKVQPQSGSYASTVEGESVETYSAELLNPNLINKYRVNYARLNGNNQTPVLIIEGDITEPTYIEIPEKSSGRLKG